MENLGIVIGIAAAVAIAIFLRNRRVPSAQRLRAALIGLVGAAAVSAAAVFGLAAMHEKIEDSATLEQAIASARALPMVGVVLDDVPGSEGLLRAALKEEIHQPTTEGVSRPLKVMRDLRAGYVVPALMAADEASAAAAIEARLALLKNLRRNDLVICKEFALTGIQHADKLDATSQKLMRDLLAALEKAYRSGRAAKAAGTLPPVAMTDAEARALLREAGFAQSDFDKLSRLARLSNEEACDFALKVSEAPASLPTDKRGPLMRYLLTVQ